MASVADATIPRNRGRFKVGAAPPQNAAGSNWERNSSPGSAPWSDFTWDYWSTVWELGYMPNDVLGLGPGVYRIQPFLARAGGPTQAGLCFNLQQQLGKDAPFGWFGRFGFGGDDVGRSRRQLHGR